MNAGLNLNLGLIVTCSGYSHPTWLPGEKCPPLIISHGLFDDVVPIKASRNIYEKVIKRSKKYHAHDEKNKFKEGEIIQIIECNPISKKKKWKVIEK